MRVAADRDRPSSRSG